MDPKKAKILLVEDDAINIAMYRLKFRLEGLNLTVTATAAEGEKAIKENKPDLILLDLQLDNNKSGFDILRDLKARPETKDIPVYILSNKRERGNSEEAARLGAVDFLSKVEVKPDEVVKIVRAKLKGS